MVPEGWETGQVRDLVESLDAGVSVNSEDDGNTCAPYKILKTSCVSSGVFKENETKSVLDDNEINRLKEPVINDSIIISRMNTPALVGANGYVEHAPINTFLPDRLWQAKPKKEKVEMRWLAYWFGSSHTRYILSSLGTGTSGSMKNITKGDVLNSKILIPPVPEQKKIAQILSTWDKAITTTEKLLKNSQQQKKALMQQLITGKKRLKGFSGEFKRFHFSQLLEIDKQNLGSKTKPDFAFDYISLSDVSPGAISRSLEKYSFKDAPSRARRIVQDGDILLATVRPILQGFARVRKVNDGAIASTGFAVLTPKSNVYGDYVYHYLFGAHITGQINALVVGTNYPAINSSDVAGLCIYCPCYEEQKEIAEVLNNCDSTTQSLNNKLEKLKQEKKALMQQLLTGKRRVK